MILVVDNYDSFVHNLARYFRQLGAETSVLRNDDPRLDQLDRLQPQAIVISPGPKGPRESGRSWQLVADHLGTTPLLGVCLGHQVLIEVCGGRVEPGDGPLHGRTSLIRHGGHPMFFDIPSPCRVCRYHSLLAEPDWIPEELIVTAATSSGEVMAVAHRDALAWGVQFHPESILTEAGYQLLANWIAAWDDEGLADRVAERVNPLQESLVGRLSMDV